MTNINLLTSKANNGDVDSCLNLMRQYALGSKEVFKDPSTARKWGNLALTHSRQRNTVSQISDKDFKRLQEEANNNQVESCVQLSIIYATGTKTMFTDMSLARKWMDKAVDLYSHPQLISEKTKDRIKEEDVAIDYATLSVEQLKELAQKGDLKACMELAQRYGQGVRGVFKDELEAKRWEKKVRKLQAKQAKRQSVVNANQHGSVEPIIRSTTDYPQGVHSEKSSSLKERVDLKYKQLDAFLATAINQLAQLRFSNDEFVKLKKDLIATLEATLDDLKKEVENNIKNVRWDKLVIAFFGETNAGKSTIIETFRILFDPNRPKNSDGLIVGDGQHDFTKEYNEYNLSINGHPFTLIDVPGIEGNESEFKDVIQEALSKAHCVFYVQGHNKKPDTGTAEKIKKYLGDWAIVYSIQNVRGSVSNYDEEEERKTLLTTGVIKNERLIKESFKQILGDVYKGNITIQALLAMCAKASFSGKTDYLQSLIRNQKKLLRYFGSAENVLKFSQFQTLLNTVDNKSQNFKDEIAKANQQKLKALTLKIQRQLDQAMQDNKDEGAALKLKMLKDFRRSVNTELSALPTKIENRVKSCIRQQFNDLKTELFNKLDSDDDKETKKQFIRNQTRFFAKELRQRLTKESNLQVQFTRNQLVAQSRKIAGVDFSKSLDFHFNTDVYFDIHTLEDGLAELDINLEDVGNVVGSTVTGASIGAGVGSFVPFVGTAIGAAVGAGLGFIGSLAVGDGGKSSAKESISDVIERAKQSVESKIRQDIVQMRNQANQRRNLLIRQVDKEIRSVDAIDDIVDELKQQIHNI